MGYSTIAIDNALADVEAHCYVVDIRRTDCEQIRSRIINNGCRMFWPHSQKPMPPKRPASVVVDSAAYLLTISSPDQALANALRCVDYQHTNIEAIKCHTIYHYYVSQ